MSSRILRPAALTVALVTVVASQAGAQERRRSPDGTGGAPPVGVPTHPRAPFAGAWQGTQRMKDGPGRNEDLPYAMLIEADSVGTRYTAFAILPDGRRHAVERVAHADGVLSWRQPNSGGGTWFYTARLVGRERIEGTLVLRDWPQGGGTTPSGTFTLVRRPPA